MKKLKLIGLLKLSTYGCLFWLIVVSLSTTSCNSPLEVTGLKYALWDTNSIRLNVQFGTDQPTDAFIEYWIKGDTTKIFKTGISCDTVAHDFILIGMYPNTNYLFKIITKDNNKGSSITSEEHPFRTDSIPEQLPKFKIVVDRGNVFSGYILVRKVPGPGSAVILDNTGNIIWYELRETALKNPFSWTSNGTIISLDNTYKINEIDLFGNQVFELRIKETPLDIYLHHEIRRVENNDIIVLTKAMQKFDLSPIGGDSQDSILGDGILRLDSAANEIWNWNIFDHVDPMEDENILNTMKDWSHANALNITQDGNYLISFRNFDQFWKINATSGEVMWKMGIGGNFELANDELFYKQHAVHEIDKNEFLIFDNGNLERQKSRALKLKIDKDEKNLVHSQSVFLPDSLFSFKQGSVYEIGNENFLFCVSTKSKIAVTNSKGRVIWQASSDVYNYRAYYMEELPSQFKNRE